MASIHLSDLAQTLEKILDLVAKIILGVKTWIRLIHQKPSPQRAI